MLRQDTALYYALLRKKNLNQGFCSFFISLIEKDLELASEFSEQLNSVYADTSKVIFLRFGANSV